MAKAPAKTYSCNNEDCDYTSGRQFGLCPQCRNGLGEEVVRPAERANTAVPIGSVDAATFTDLKDVSSNDHDRLPTGVSELDRVLGGGIVPGSYIVLAGEPGAGKTTLSTQTIIKLAAAGQKVAYVSGEESEAQARMRFERLGAKFGEYPLPITTELSVERVCEAIYGGGFDLVVVDSIQTLISEGHPGRAGSVSQVAECGEKLRRAAKNSGTSVLLVGQVTKDGDMAGPRTLEHMVDVVMAFEGDRDEQFRILRSVKNRFGSTDEIGVFEMTERGLKGIPDPSQLFLSERDAALPGTAVCAVLEGSRVVLCEVQALVRDSNQPMPTRQVSGVDPKRVQMLLAVLSKAGYRVGGKDVFVQVIGGLKVTEPAIDLAVCLAVASAHESRLVRSDACAFGEVTLQGKVRAVGQTERRKREAQRLGYDADRASGELRTVLRGMLGEQVDEPGLPEEEPAIA